MIRRLTALGRTETVSVSVSFNPNECFETVSPVGRASCLCPTFTHMKMSGNEKLLPDLRGCDLLLAMSRPTRIKHRNVLLKYGIDIIEPPSQIMLDLWSQTKPVVFSNWDFQSKSPLTVVK